MVNSILRGWGERGAHDTGVSFHSPQAARLTARRPASAQVFSLADGSTETESLRRHLAFRCRTKCG